MKLHDVMYERDPSNPTLIREGMSNSSTAKRAPLFPVVFTFLEEKHWKKNTLELRKKFGEGMKLLCNSPQVQRDCFQNDPGVTVWSNRMRCGGDVTPKGKDKDDLSNALHVSDILRTADVMRVIQQLHPKEGNNQLSHQEIVQDEALMAMCFNPKHIHIRTRLQLVMLGFRQKPQKREQ